MLSNSVVYALASIGVLGGILGIGLAWAARILAVKKDELQTKVEEALPGINCGACGFTGCAGYAEALIKDNAELDKCAPGGPDLIVRLAEILGKQAQPVKERQAATIMCAGQLVCRKKYLYQGIDDCNSLYSLFNGDRLCRYGCLNLGSCKKVCPVDAIAYDKEGKIKVHRDKCVACGKCLKVCPTKVMQYTPARADLYVACNSTEKGAALKKYCQAGCLGCRICQKKSPGAGFVIENFLAKIDYSQSGERETAQKACPSKCIVSV